MITFTARTLAVLFILVASHEAVLQAYIDPDTGSMVVQGIADPAR